MLAKWKIELEDGVRYSRFVRNGLSGLLLLRAMLDRSAGKTGLPALERLCEAARLASSTWLRSTAERTIRRRLARVEGRESLQALLPQDGLGQLAKTIILKPYVSSREKGVVFLSFANQWGKLAFLPAVAELLSCYRIVVAPSWSPPHSVVNYVAPRLIPGTIFTLISNERDLETFRRIADSYEPIPLYASSWVDPALFRPISFEQKSIDLIMVANFGKFKRHHVLFRALQDLPRSLRVVLVGQSERGRTAEDVRAEARAYGVEDRFEIIEDAPYAQVCELLAAARISLIFSLREGSCVVVTESMLANTPVGIFEDAELGSRVFVNEATGRFLKRGHVARQLSDFLEAAHQYQPRAWAIEHGITCVASSERLNDTLKRDALASGGEWTCDLAALRWVPDPDYVYASDGDRMAGAYVEFQHRFGLRIKRFMDEPAPAIRSLVS